MGFLPLAARHYNLAPNLTGATMRTDKLRERLIYLEEKLHEAQTKYAANEPHPRSFNARYTEELFKTWPGEIDLLLKRSQRLPRN
jgi:hypothetical protein